MAKHISARVAVSKKDKDLTPCQRAKKQRLLRREADPQVQGRVLRRATEANKSAARG